MAYQSKFFRDKQGGGGGDSNSSAPVASGGGNYRSRFFQSGAYRSAVGASGLQIAETHERQDVTDNWERLPSRSRAETVPAPSMRRTVREELASGRNPVMGQTVRDMGRAGIPLAEASATKRQYPAMGVVREERENRRQAGNYGPTPDVDATTRSAPRVQAARREAEAREAQARLDGLNSQIRDLQRQGAASFSTAGRSAAEARTQQIQALQAQADALRREIEAVQGEKPGVGEWLGRNAAAGMAQFNRGLMSSLDFFLPTELVFGEENDPVSRLNRYYAGQGDIFQGQAARVNEAKGGVWRAAGELGVQNTVAAVPNAVLALMSMGGSVAAQGGAALGQAASGLGSTLMNIGQGIARNPMFWTSVLQTTGPVYDQAVAEGASELEATSSALITGLLNSVVEVGGGIETLPAKLRGNPTGQAVREWVRSMLDEGKEEVIQGVIENLTAKTIYRPEAPVFSLEDETAVFHPGRAVEEFTGGAVVGGILGGAQMGAVGLVNAVGGRMGDAKAGAQLRGYGDEVVRAVIDEGLEGGPETASRRMAQNLRQKQEAGQAVSDAELGALYRENVRTVEQEEGAVRAPMGQEPVEAGRGYARSAEDAARAPEQARKLAATLGENGGRAFLTVTEKEADPVTAFQGFAQVYNAARKGKPAPAGVELAPHIALAARESGRRDAHVAAQAAYFGEGAGLLRDASFRAAKVDRKTARTLDAVAKAAGVQVKFADRLVDEATGLEANAQYENRVITISRAASDPVKTAFTHEIAHRIREVDPQAWSTLSSYVLEHMEGEEMAGLARDISAKYQTQDSGLIYEELVADAVGQLAGDGNVLEDFVKRHGGVARRVLDAVRDLLDRVKRALGKGGAPLTAEERGAFQSLYRDVEGFSKALSSALEQTARTVEAGGQKNAAQAGGGVRYSLNADFGRQFDQWLAGRTQEERENSHFRFEVGTTSDALKSIGVSDYKIYWGASKIAKVMEKHPGMTADVIKSVPEVLEHPVLVMQSQTVANRITLFGEAMDADGMPVLVAVELSPQKKTGEIRDFGVIASAYGKKNAQGIIDTSDILYVEPDKKRTDQWLLVLGLQLPSSITTYGSIHSVTQVERDVNGNISFGDTGGKTAMELAFEKARKEKGDAVNQAEAGEGKVSLKAASESREEFYRLREMNAYLREQLRVSKVAKTDKKAVERLASTILDEYSSAYDREALTGELRGLYDFMANGRDADGNELSWAPLYERAAETARRILEGARVLNDEAYQEYGALRDFLRTTRLTLAEADRADVPGGYADFTRRNRGRILTGKDGVAVDTAYRELAARWPEFFDEEITHPADQLARMEDVLDQLRPVYENPFEGDLEQAAEYLAGDIIERFYATPQQAPTQADKAQRRLTEQKIHDDKKLERLREEKNARIAEIQAQGRERVRQVLQRERARRAEEVEAVKEHYRGREAEGRERRSARELRAKIQRHVSKLSQKLLRPSDKQHIPEALRGPVAAMLEAINLESRYTIDQETGKRVKGGDGLPTKRTEAFFALKEQYAEIIKAGGDMVIDPSLMGSDAEGIKGGFDAVIAMRDTRLADMSVSQLATVWQVVKAVEHSVSTAGKVLSATKYAGTMDWANQLMADTATRRNKRSLTHGHALIDMETPYTFFSHYGDAGKAIYRMLRDAQDRQQLMVDRVAGEVGKVVDSKTVKALERAIHTFNTERGEKLTLSTAQVMELYELMKRTQAHGHLLKGGIVQPEIESANIRRGTDSIRLTEGDLANIVMTLTDQQVQIADGLQRLTTGLLADYGNEASMAAYGYKKFTGTDYWPIKSAKEGVHSSVERGGNNTRSIKNIGMAKTTVPNASNPLDIAGIFSTFSAHASDMTDYAAWLCAMEDVNRLFNFQFRDGEGNLTGKSIKSILDRVGGPGAQKYWHNLMEDIQNGINAPSDSPTWDIIGRGIGSFKGAAVGGNIRVAIQQPTAFFRAAAVLSPADLSRGLARGVTRGNGWKKALQYSPIAMRKDVGSFDISSPRQMSELLFDDRTSVRKLNDALSVPAGLADAVTWGRLWNACEWATSREHEAIAKGSPEFYKAVNALFTEVIDQTQVVDGVLQRSNIMRSSNAVVKQATSFMGEPIMSLNLMLRAYDQVRYEQNPRKRSRAIKTLGRAATALVLTNVVNALAQSLIDALRDDDEDKKYWERFMSAFTGITGDEESAWDMAVAAVFNGNVGSNMNLLGQIPFVKDALSMLQGYDVTRTEMEIISDLIEAGQTAAQSFGGDGKKTRAYAVKELLAAGAKVKAIPVGNLARDVWGLARSITVETGNIPLQYEMEKAIFNITNDGNKGRYYDILFRALAQGDMDSYQHIRDEMMDQMGLDGAKIDSAMRSRYKSALEADPGFTLSQRARDLIAARDQYAAAAEPEETFGADDLGKEAYRAYSTQRANDYREIADGLEDSPIFRGMDDEVKDAVLKAAYDLAEQSALEDASDGQYEATTEWMTLTDDAERLGLEPWEYVLFHVAYNQAESTKGRDGKTVKGEAKSDHVREWLESDRSLTERQREFLWGTVYQSEW